jgi:uncharacterized protein (TIGR01777 family)
VSGHLRVAISGASGFIGSALVTRLGAEGHRVLRLVRRPSAGTDEIAWDPEGGQVDSAKLEGLDAVVHLAGESIAGGRWNAERKQRIRQSRVQGTSLLAGALARLSAKPRVLVSGSAMGVYGDRGDEVLVETSPPGTGFLADVGQAWEAAADPARLAGIRVVHPRFGMVLHPSGGGLERMLPPFRMGLGGQLGNGQQWMSWSTRDDAVSIIRAAILDEALSGPVNASSPNPVRNAEFTRLLGAALHRPAIAAVPAFALELMFGELAKEALLASQRMMPARLQELGFTFADPDLEPALVGLLRGG